LDTECDYTRRGSDGQVCVCRREVKKDHRKGRKDMNNASFFLKKPAWITESGPGQAMLHPGAGCPDMGHVLPRLLFKHSPGVLCDFAVN
jgi:hypothetical protein